MAVTDREYAALSATVADHAHRIDLLERARDELAGASRESARIYGRVLAVVGVLGMLGQLVIAVTLH